MTKPAYAPSCARKNAIGGITRVCFAAVEWRPMIPHCVRCGAPAGIVMAFAYEARLVWLEDLDGPVVPGAGYAFCAGPRRPVHRPGGLDAARSPRPGAPPLRLSRGGVMPRPGG